MKSFKYIVLTVILFMVILSCRKEKLEDEKEIFIGKWELVNSFYQNYIATSSSNVCQFDTLCLGSGTTFLDFRKKGLVILERDSKNKRYSLDFGKVIENDIVDMEQREFNTLCSDTINPEIGLLSFHYLYFHESLQFLSDYPISCHINNNWLILNSTSDIIGDTEELGRNESYYHVFKKVN